MRFAWNQKKAEANLKKHGVSFLEAQSAFDDDYFVAFVDPDHSLEENRFLLLGRSERGRLLYGTK